MFCHLEYEIEFEKLLSTDKTTKRLTFQEVRKFFEACNLYPSTEELMKAVRKCLDEEGNFCYVSPL